MARFIGKTRFEFIQGKLAWCKLKTPDSQYGCWVAQIHPTPESLNVIRDMQAEGLKNVIKKDEDGYYTRFRCPTHRQRKDGSIWTFQPPVVVDKDNRPIDGDLVGNGSDGTLKLEVYEHPTPTGGRSIAARLVGARIDNLVEYNPDKELDEETRRKYEGLKEAPPLF